MQPVDLTNLREMTDGDLEMEKELFEEFCASFEAGLAALKACTEDGISEGWKREAHGLKGIALNLGAVKLGEWCSKAQDQHKEDKAVKLELQDKILQEYEAVKRFLSNI